MMETYLDDTLVCGKQQDIDEIYKEFEKHLNIERLGSLKKHLGDFSEGYHATGRDTKRVPTPGLPGKPLRKSTEETPTMITENRSIVGKIVYLQTMIGPEN
jgi:hypothetical protein